MDFAFLYSSVLLLQKGWWQTQRSFLPVCWIHKLVKFPLFLIPRAFTGSTIKAYWQTFVVGLGQGNRKNADELKRKKKRIIILPPVTKAAKEKLQAEAWETTELHMAEPGENCWKACCYIKRSETHKHHTEKNKTPTLWNNIIIY